MKYSDVERAERLLKGYCTYCYEPEDAHSDDCPIEFDSRLDREFAKILRDEMDKELIKQLKELAKKNEQGNGTV